MAETVLVTGAAGFIGRHVARAAAAGGATVLGLGHGTWAKREWSRWGLAEWRAGDVRSRHLRSYAERANIIVHCAAGASVGFSIEHPAQDFRRTVETTLEVLEALRAFNRSARLVLPSSAGVYGAAARMPIQVGSELRPVSPYGMHKKMAEDLCRSYALQYGLNVAVVRLFSVYGPGLRKQLLWDACHKLTAADGQFSGTGSETRDWLHVEDAAKLLLAAAPQAGSHCPTANGGSGAAATVREVLTLLADALPGCAPPVFTGQQRAGDPIHYQADLREAIAWAWRPQRSWREGVREYAQWFQAGAA